MLRKVIVEFIIHYLLKWFKNKQIKTPHQNKTKQTNTQKTTTTTNKTHLIQV